jgi:hypothetical protein
MILKNSFWSRRVDRFFVKLDTISLLNQGRFDLTSAIATQYGDVILSTSVMLPDVSINVNPFCLDSFGR